MLIINHKIEILVVTESQSMRLYREYSPLRWLNTVLAVSEYMSFAKSRQEKGFSLQAETWQVKSTDESLWLTGKIWRFRSFHGKINDWMQP